MIPNNGGKLCGIYAIHNDTTGQLYIGQSIDINRRYWQHVNQPADSSRIDLAIQKHGANNFSLFILAITPENREVLNWLEKAYIQSYNTYSDNFHYNLTPGGESLIGDNNPRYRHDIPSDELLYREWKSGASQKELMEKYNCGEATIKRRLRKVKKEDGRYNHHIPSNEVLFKEWQDGLTQKELALKYKCSVSQIEHRMRTYKEKNNINNVKTNHGKHSYNFRPDIPDGKELVNEINATQMTYKQIAEKYNCSQSLINHRIRNARNKIMVKHYQNVPNGEELLQEYNSSNCTQRELAEKYNCSLDCIKGRIRSARKKLSVSTCQQQQN